MSVGVRMARVEDSYPLGCADAPENQASADMSNVYQTMIDCSTHV